MTLQPQAPGNVLPFPVSPSGSPDFRMRADITSEIDRLLKLEGEEEFLTRLRMSPAGLEPALHFDAAASDANRAIDAKAFVGALRRCHARGALYVIEKTGPAVWGTVAEGELLMVAPSAKLRLLGLCLLAFADERAPQIRVFLGQRRSGQHHVWLTAQSNPNAVSALASEEVVAIQPILGSIKSPLFYGWSTPTTIYDFAEAADSHWEAINPAWRPGVFQW